MKYCSLVIFMFIIIFSSCKKPNGCEDIMNPDCHNYIINIFYKDSSGNDLFTDGTNGYIANNVFLSTMDSTVLSNVSFTYWQDMGNICTVGNLTGQRYSPNSYISALIHLKPNVVDTLRCHIPAGGNYDSMWYNGVYKPIIDRTADTMTIVKYN